MRDLSAIMCKCGRWKDLSHPRSLCFSCDKKEKDAYLLNVVEQALDLVDPEEWPGCHSNLRMAQAIMKGEIRYVPADVMEQLRALGKLRGM